MRRLSVIALCLLSACSLTPAYVRPASPVPASWPVGDAYLARSEAALPSVSYAQVFGDPRLRQLIAQGLENNRDLRVALADIAQARAQYRIQRAALFPEIDGSASATRSYSGGGAASADGGGSQGAAPKGYSSAYSVGLAATAFEIDLFGRIRSLTAAAQDRYLEQEAAARATRLTLVGDIATAWLTYASDRSLLALAQDTARSAEESVSLTRQRQEEGIVPRSELDQANQVLHAAQSDLAEQTTALAQDVNALRLLVGGAVDPSLLPASMQEAAASVGELPAGLDSSILLRRPDVVQAEYELQAVNAEIGAARAALFPRITLTALLGMTSGALSDLFTHQAANGSIGAGAGYAIFDAGAARANLHATQAQRDAAVAAYEKTVQTAFMEVSDALARRGTIDAQWLAQQRLVADAASSYAFSDQRYREGVESSLSHLDAQRSYYAAQRSLVSTELVKATNLVTLYRTLGGDATLETLPLSGSH
ncbi:efflux transporter outer membrane subunit [Pseudoxanthomonas winnipegensis]|uniref:efflux transporter outer membrane subunit n=1 Tax=Pseudoxanthomonas winnipegensis TaxID=2480810 RepID=UPI0019818B35|nr:efflux transporter outer membrane subunit [Pseudoxanthomonas winnipegensis]